MLAQPFASAIGATVSGIIPRSDAGPFWGWLAGGGCFCFEGLPAVIVGIIAYFYLTDRPEKSSWFEF